jgi:hypothetical protein
MKHKDSVLLGDIYGKMLNGIKQNIKESNKSAFEEKPDVVGDGPKTDGFHEALNDEKGCTCKKDGKECKCKEEDEEISLKKKKINIEKVNSIMSKSAFDKIYSKLLKENFGVEDQDVDALGLDDATPDSEFDFGDEGGDDLGEEGDTVTLTLDKATAQALVDVLQAALGGGEEEGDLGEEGDDLDFGGEGDGFGDEEPSFEEDEEEGTKEAPKKNFSKLQGKDNKVGANPKPKGGSAKTDVTDETGTKVGTPPIAALQGKNNQVPGSTIKKASDYFQ